MARLDREDDNREEQSSEGDFFDQHKKLFVGILGFFFLCIAVIISVTLSLTFSPKPTSTLDLETRLEEITLSVQAMEASINEQNLILAQNQQKYDALQTHLKHSSATTLKNILIDQEKNFQSFLMVLRAGMRDLSVEIPNGADWYDDYNDQMSKAVKRSIQRQDLLNMLRTGEVTE